MAYVGTPIDVGNQFSSLVGKRFSGDASTTAFTLDVRANSALDIEVFVENVRQDPNSAYTVDGTTLTFTAAPPSGTNNVYVVHQAPTVASVSPTAGSVTASSFDNSVISGHTALAAIPATTDELLISDAGTIKRIDAQFFQNTPSFQARLSSGQSISDNSSTKVSFDTEDFDTDSAYDHATNYRFTPQVAGKYCVYVRIGLNANADNELNTIFGKIKKNGSIVDIAHFSFAANYARFGTANITAIVTLNGSSDYVEAFIQGSDQSGSASVESGTYSIFGAYKIIGA